MSSQGYGDWLAAGRPFDLAYPVVDLASTLRRYGYDVGTIGNNDHLTAQFPEDHTPFSVTGWPVSSPRWWVHALDIMAPPAGSGLPDLGHLGAQLAADRANGVTGADVIKYMNWSPPGMGCRHESWEPGHVIAPSSDVGHIHVSIRSDTTRSRAAAGYDPVARVRAGGFVVPVVTHPPMPAGYPAYPGRLLVEHDGPGMLHGTDVSTWQGRMRARGWSRLAVDGWYGPTSAAICRQFQADSTAHGWHLDGDGIVGPATWAATWQRPVS